MSVLHRELSDEAEISACSILNDDSITEECLCNVCGEVVVNDGEKPTPPVCLTGHAELLKHRLPRLVVGTDTIQRSTRSCYTRDILQPPPPKPTRNAQQNQKSFDFIKSTYQIAKILQKSKGLQGPL